MGSQRDRKQIEKGKNKDRKRTNERFFEKQYGGRVFSSVEMVQIIFVFP